MASKENEVASGPLDAATIAQIVSQSVAQTIASIQGQTQEQGRIVNASEKIAWGLQKTLCPEKLDIATVSRAKYQSWEQCYRSFVREAKLGNKSWDIKSTAFQTCMTSESFAKANALRLQQPVAEQENFEKFMTIIKELVETTRPTWVARHQFQMIKQQQETARQFYSTVAEIAEDCAFSKEFCENCKQKSVDQMILMKLVFDTTSDDARREILKKKDLKLEDAIAELETQENLMKTQSELQTNNPSVNRFQKPTHRSSSRGRMQNRQNEHQKSRNNQNRRSPSQSTKCYNCGQQRHSSMKQCPAKGKMCDECGRMNHFSRVCRTKEKRKTEQPKKLGRIVRSIAGKCKRPLVNISINGKQGDDWHVVTVSMACGYCFQGDYWHVVTSCDDAWSL